MYVFEINVQLPFYHKYFRKCSRVRDSLHISCEVGVVFLLKPRFCSDKFLKKIVNITKKERFLLLQYFSEQGEQVNVLVSHSIIISRFTWLWQICFCGNGHVKNETKVHSAHHQFLLDIKNQLFRLSNYHRRDIAYHTLKEHTFRNIFVVANYLCMQLGTTSKGGLNPDLCSQLEGPFGCFLSKYTDICKNFANAIHRSILKLCPLKCSGRAIEQKGLLLLGDFPHTMFFFPITTAI